MFIILAFIIGYIGFTIYAANQAHFMSLTKQLDYDPDYERQKSLVRTLLISGVILIGLCGLFVVMSASVAEDPSLTEELPEISTWEMLFGVGTSLICGFAAYSAVTTLDFRKSIKGRISGLYNPESIVHTTAIVLALFILAGQMAQFAAIGGIDGMADSYAESGVDGASLLFDLFLQIAAAFLGVGYAIRRDMFQSLDRLGLRIPTNDDMRYGLFIGFGMFGAALIFGIVIGIFAEIFPILDELSAANDSMVLSITTIPMAILLAGSAAIGEEILFRGALQPVFGISLTSAFFVLLHIQLIFTPGIILLFFVSYGLGWVRKEQSTTAAIIAHFVYNFAQLLIVVLVG